MADCLMLSVGWGIFMLLLGFGHIFVTGQPLSGAHLMQAMWFSAFGSACVWIKTLVS